MVDFTLQPIEPDDAQDAPGASRSAGTRFRVYPQAPHLAGYETPETIWIAKVPGSIGPGPSDDRMYVVDPLFDKDPYEPPYLPPYDGDTHVPALPDAEGHFDHIPENSRAFLSAHAYACVARVLDIWESYTGGNIPWHFGEAYKRLEIVPYLDWDDAQSGFGYLELGHEAGGRNPHALNFDVIAHEVGHSVLFSQVGLPSGRDLQDFAPFHEGNADLISLLSFMHFDTGLDRLLRHCQGNLLVLNELNRIAELSGDRQIRVASNARRMSEVSGEVHDQSRPLTGAVFDTIVDSYQARLVEEGYADERLLDIDIRNLERRDLDQISRIMAKGFQSRPYLFKSALARARDDVAVALALSWRQMDADNLTFSAFASALVDESHRLSPQLSRQFEVNLNWREII